MNKPIAPTHLRLSDVRDASLRSVLGMFDGDRNGVLVAKSEVASDILLQAVGRPAAAKAAVPIATRIATGALSQDLATLDKRTVNATLAAAIDHTQLAPEATRAQIDRLCAEAAVYGFRAVCVVPKYAGMAAHLLKGTSVKIACVVGFPMGTSTTAAKVKEAQAAVRAGATEIDMVAHTTLVDEGMKQLQRGALPTALVKYFRDVRAVAAKAGAPVKVILQTNLLRKLGEQSIAPDATAAEKQTVGDSYVRMASRLAARALLEAENPGFLKTSDGVYTKATPEDAKLLRAAIDEESGALRAAGEQPVTLAVKIAGGVREAKQAADYIALCGSDTIFGTSGGISLVTAQSNTASY